MHLLIAGLIFISFACKEQKSQDQTEEIQSEKVEENAEELKDKDYKSLQSLLDEKKALFVQNAPEEKKRVYDEGILDVKNSGILSKALNVGDVAPDFVLKNQNGEDVSLSSKLSSGPVILTWYRGGWCPYCNITLNRLQSDLPEIKALNAELIALTPELPDSSLNTAEKNNLEFSVLSDLGNEVARSYGIVYKLMPEVATYYQNGFDLHAFNGDESDELPLAATYVIDTNGEIIYAFLHEDYRMRAEPSEILEALKNINS